MRLPQSTNRICVEIFQQPVPTCSHYRQWRDASFLENLFVAYATPQGPIAEGPRTTICPLPRARGGGAAADELGEGEGVASEGWLVGERPPARSCSGRGGGGRQRNLES